MADRVRRRRARARQRRRRDRRLATGRGPPGRLAIVLVAALGLSGCVAVRDDARTAVWQAYGNDATSVNDWTGGDGAASAALPDGRVAWVFADTFLGRVDQHPSPTPPSRPTSSPLVRNTLVVARGGTPTQTLTGPTGGDLIPPLPGTSEHFNTGDATVEQGQLDVVAFRFGATFGVLEGTYVASFSLPGLVLQGVRQAPPTAPSATGILWGIGLLEEADFTYVYGAKGGQPSTYLARAPAGDLLGAWQYRTASGWSPDEREAVAISQVAGGVVFRSNETFFLVGRDGSVPPPDTIFTRDIVGCASSVPWGPFPPSSCQRIYNAPEANGSTRIIYSVQPHPEDVTGKGLLLSYSVNSWNCASCNYDDATIYRPRFVRVLP